MAFTQYGIGVGIVTVLLVASALVARWTGLQAWWHRRLRRKAQPEVQAIVARLLEQITASSDRRRLYTTLLRFFCDLAGTESGTLLVRNGDPNKLLVRETLGVKPGSFQVGDLSAFITWLKRQRRTVTRHALVNDPALGEIKPIGLQFCVQFHAEACVPCFLGEGLLAILTLGPRQDHLPYDREQCGLLDLLAGQCAVAIHNVNLVEDLTRQHQALKQMGTLKAHLLANLSHELRTPIAGVIGLADHLLDEGQAIAPHEQRRYLQMMREAGGRLLTTVTALMDLAKLEADRNHLEIRRINVTRMIQEICAGLKPTAATSLSVHVGDEVPPVYGDAGWIRRVLEHLLDNAVKFTPQGKIWIEARRQGDMLELGVHDTGIGIPKEQHESVFEGFVQGSHGAARSHEGNGIGLSIARKVVQIHGGRMWLTSAPGEGSHVYFTLPVKPAAL